MGNSERCAHHPHTSDPLNKDINIFLFFVQYFIHGQDPVGSPTNDSYIFNGLVHLALFYNESFLF